MSGLLSSPSVMSSPVNSNRLTSSKLQSPATTCDPEQHFTSPLTTRFRHPGYQGLGDDLLFSLPCFDTATGVHYGTAYTACAIIANNAFDGYLTASRDGPRLLFDYDDLLTAREHWFHVPRPPSMEEGQGQASEGSILQQGSPSYYCYAIVPSFADWQFPHQYFDRWPGNGAPRYHLESWGPAQYSPPWPRSTHAIPPTSISQVSITARIQGPECRISGSVEYIESAHIIPAAEEDWYNRNEMECYSRDPEIYGVRNTNNLVALRPDIHRAFDDHRIAIVPKCGAFTVHFLGDLPWLAQQFHNRRTHSLEWVPVPWLLSRFALAIIPRTYTFLRRGIPRKLVRWNSDQRRYLEETVAENQCVEAAQRFRSTKSGSQSPKKRLRSSATCDSIDSVGESEMQDYESLEERQTKRARLNEYLANLEEDAPPDDLASTQEVSSAFEEAKVPDLSHTP